nr:immunoglobulin light chain junction region [Macaca mulatta]
CLQGYRPPYSL